MNKKVALSLLSATVFASMTASAFAAPKSGVYMGGDVDRYYALTDLFKLNDAGYAKFQSDLAKTKFENLIFVDHDGKGASLKEILSSTQDFEKIKRDLKQNDFEGEYAKSNLDGTNGESYDPRKDITPEPTGDLKVESVSAINATQVQVVFGVKVDKDDAAVVDNYTIGGVNPESAELAEDGKTVTLTFADPTSVEVTNAAVVIEPVVTADDSNKTTARYAGLLTYEDTVNPEVIEVTAKTNGDTASSVTINFSEPVKAGTIKINGVAQGTADKQSKTISGLSLAAGVTHKLEIVNLTDSGENVVSLITKEFTVTTDANAPSVSSVAAHGDSKFLVTFSKKMDKDTLSKDTIAVKDEALKDVEVIDVQPLDTTNTKFVVTLNTEGLYATKTSRTLTVVFAEDEITDSLGNPLALTTKNVTLTKDVTGPTVTGFSFDKDSEGKVTTVRVKFNEELAENDNVAEDLVTVIDANGVKKNGFFKDGSTVAAGDKEVKLSLETSAKLSGTYTLTVGKGLVKDQASTPNDNTAYTGTINFGAADPSKFQVVDIDNVADTTNTFEVDFGVPVKGGVVDGSATDLAKYTLNGAALPNGTTITLNDTLTKATITLPEEGSVAKSDAAAIITVAGVKNAAGVLVTPYTDTVKIKDNVKPELSTALLNSDGTVTLTFSEALATPAEATDFQVIVNGKTLVNETGTSYTVTAISAGAEKGKYLVEVKVAVAAGEDDVDADDKLYIDADGSGDFTADKDILIGTSDYTDENAGTFSLKNSVIKSVKVGTIAEGTPIGADADENPLKLGTVKTVK